MSRLHIIYKARLLPQPPVKKVNSSRSFRRHALVADDCVSSRLLTRAVLRSFDFTVDCVAHGRSALESSRVQPYSVVFLDAQMPKMSRPEIVAHLKGAWTQSWERPRFVVIGADKQSEESELWRACGVTDYLPKPVTIPALKNCLKTMRTEVQRSHAEEGKGGGELIDWTALDTLRDQICPLENKEHFNRIFTKFVEEITELLESLKKENAPAENDRHVLHKLKGLMGFMAMKRGVKLVVAACESGLLQNGDQRRQWVDGTSRIVDLGVSEIVTRYAVIPA